MKLKSAIAAAIALAFAAGSAVAQTRGADKPLDGKNDDGKVTKKEAANASRSDDSGFARMDKNKDGYISKAEAKSHKELTANFDKWDMNNDGRINRAEYLAAMAKHDTGRAVDKVTGTDDPARSDSARGSGGAAGGASSRGSSSADKPLDGKGSDGKLSKKEAANASRSDTSGFAKMDKNKDGYISKAEAKSHKELTANFDKWDMNNDGRINRAEYLAAMAKHDAGRAVDKVTGGDDPARSDSARGAGSTSSSTSSNAARTDSTPKPKN